MNKRIPNELTAKTIADAERGIDVYEVDSVDDLFEDLEDEREDPIPGR